ncbi:MAG: GAF domain-containing protein [Thermodesulfobacteriota bacterium]
MASARVTEIMGLVTNVMEAFTVALFLPRPGAEGLSLHAFHSFSRQIDPEVVIQPGEGMVGWVFREQRPMLVNSFERSTTTLKFYQADEGIKSFLAVPLPDRRGVLCADSKKSYLFTERNEKVFGQLAWALAEILRLEEETAALASCRQFLGLLQSVDTIVRGGGLDGEERLRQGLLALLRATAAGSLFYVVPGQRILRIFAEGKAGHEEFLSISPRVFENEGLVGWVINKRRILVLDHIVEEGGKAYLLRRDDGFGSFANFIGIPVAFRKKGAFGAVALINHRGGFTDHEIAIMEIACRQIVQEATQS